MNQDIKKQITGIELQFEKLIKDFECKYELIKGEDYRVYYEFGDYFDGYYSHCEIETNNIGTNVWISIFVCFNGVEKKENGQSSSIKYLMNDIVNIDKLID